MFSSSAEHYGISSCYLQVARKTSDKLVGCSDAFVFVSIFGAFVSIDDKLCLILKFLLFLPLLVFATKLRLEQHLLQ